MKKPVKLLLFVMLLIGFLYIENNFIAVDRLNFPTDHKIVETIKIMHLSDLHGRRIENAVSSFARKFGEESPDVIFITGDIVSDDEEDTRVYVKYLKSIFKDIPVYYVDGNHEHSKYKFYGEFSRYMKESNFINISSDCRFVKIKDCTIFLAGLQDPLFYNKTDERMIKERITSIDKTTDYFKILLSHRSEYTPIYNASTFDLILTGHAHGGVIGIPFTQGNLYSSAEGFFPKYTKGLHTKTYISRGLGGSRFSLRLFNHPQMSVITLHP